MPELELGPVWLSLQLATVTVLVLLLIATPLAWWLAFTRSRARTIVEAVVAMPLVLPPTVLGFYLLVLLGPAGATGLYWMLYRYYRNTDKSHAFERETEVKAQPVTGAEHDRKVDEVKGTQARRIEDDNVGNYRERVERIRGDSS